MGMAERYARCEALVDKYYPDVPSRDAVLDETVLPLLGPGQRLLDAGCGDTLILLRRYAPKVSFGVGVDVVTPSRKAEERSAVTLADLGRLPFQDETFDVVVSRSVVEHLEHPEDVFRELARTMRPGGTLVFSTPNKYYYSCLVALLVPFRVKDWYMRWAFGPDCYDHFPVFYRANTRGALARIAKQAGFRIKRVRALRHYPFYLMFSPLLFRLGMLYDWIITALRLDALQSTWFVVMERTGDSSVEAL